MTPLKLNDETWNKLLKIIRDHPNTYVGDEAACRRFVEAVLWMVRSGAQWRLLPAEYGNWNSIYKRFARWQETGVWEAIFTNCGANPDLEHLLIDATITRAHPCAAGALKKTVARKTRH
jgi:transposase